jgi:hypothetical protein
MSRNRGPLLPRDAVIDRMMMAINGTQAPDTHRLGYMGRERAAHTIDLFKAAMSNPARDLDNTDWMTEEFKKSVTIATGLTYYDLRAPALNLFPTVTPLRNSIPRDQRPNPGEAAHWKAVLATVGSGYPYMGWVPEGKRSASMSYVTQNVTMPYATLGEEDSLTEEARFAAQGFEDEDSLVQLRLLLKMFVKEEAALLGGNAGPIAGGNGGGVQLGTPSAPATGASGSNGTLASATYSVMVVGLTQEGYLNSSLSTGVATQLTITGNDNGVYTLNGGSSNKSANTTQAVTLGQTLTATVGTPAQSPNGSYLAPVLAGVVAWAWFVGTAGAETLQAITTINSVAISAPLATGRQAATAISADNSSNPGLAFNGLLNTAFGSGSNAYVASMATGTAGVGTTLSPSGAGGIKEVDTMLKTMWDTYRISPTVIYVNSQELQNMTAKVLTTGSAPLLRYNSAADQAGMVEYKLTAAGVISFYFNPFSADGGVRIPIKIHPNLAAGTVMGYAEKLPPWYVSNATPEVAVVQTRQDYYAEVWPKTTRTQFYGVYAQEALAVYAPFSTSIICNIGNG